MLISGTGRQRRPYRSSTRRLVITAVTAGACLTLPLLGASGAAAAPSSRQSTTHDQWKAPRERHAHHGHHGTQHRQHAPTAQPAAPSGTPSPTPSATASQPADSTGAVQQVLALINKARAAQGLPGYTITTGLTRSAESHNQVMANGCGLSHQCPGEAALGDRQTTAGVQWNAVGENIGEGGPVGSAAQDSASMAVSLTQDMLDEKPPNDGHRQNIQNNGFAHIGIAVQRDAQGTVWLTQDFSN